MDQAVRTRGRHQSTINKQGILHSPQWCVQ